jgi:glycosyltransferase involved in cell wall biosynthesis/peptidoglycan/xylan/chitin deacetylase (PgdA/CDA1 family)
MPELSVIIPSFNRSARLRSCLEALAVQTQLSQDFEIIVVVDGSTDDTMAMLESFEAPFSLRAFWQENAGQASARNRGIAEANGRVCLFLDDDIVASPGLVAAHLRAHDDAQEVVGVGQLTLALPEGADEYTVVFAESWRAHYEALDRGVVTPGWEDCYSGNLSAPREQLLECGGFATDLVSGEDVELGYRLWKAGCTITYLPNAAGRQDERKSFRELSRDAEKAGEAALAFYRRDPDMLSEALASFCAGGWRKLLLTRFLLATRTPPVLLAWCGRLLPGPSRRRAWFGLIRKLCYWRGVRRAAADGDTWRRLTSGTPVLLFHAIGKPSEPAGPYRMPRERFEAHLRWIKRLGYRPIRLEEFLDCRRQRRFPPARSVVLTFDDGYADLSSEALPLLRRHETPATIFLVSQYVGTSNRWDETGELAGRPLMDWNQVRDMAAHGNEFGAHSQSHAALTRVDPHVAAAEIEGSRHDIEHALGRPVQAFAYPYGLHDADVRKLVERAGYAAGFTVDPGLNCLGTPASALHRAEIWGTDSIVRLGLALWLGDAEAVSRRRRG